MLQLGLGNKVHEILIGDCLFPLIALFKPVIPANYRTVTARDVALSLIEAVRKGQPGCRVLLSGALQRG